MARVLLIAYACDRDDVSETWCAHQWASHLIRRHDATVLAYNRRDRCGAARDQLPGARVFEWRELPGLDATRTFSDMVKPGYLDFYWRARRLIRRLLRTESFDVVHQFEPFAPRYPSPAAGLGVPLIMGPVGGAVATPPGFAGEVGESMRWYTKLRGLDRWRFAHDPWLRHTYASADVVLGIAPYVRELIGALPLRRFDCMHETGVESLPPATARRPPQPGVLRLLYVGRIVRTKGVRDAVRALAQVGDLPGTRLDVVGDGGDRAACEAEARRLGVADRVVFHGWLDRDAVQRCYAEADVFLFPSFREASGQVVVEAMSHGLAMIVADSGGPGFTVGDTCGIAVPPRNPEQFATDLGAAIRRLARDPALVSRYGRAARQRVADDFLWARKVDRMDALYAEVARPSAAPAAPRVAAAGG